MSEIIKNYFEESANNFIKLKEISNEIHDVMSIVIKALSDNKKVMFCGNGGSASDSQHLAAELMGRYKLDRNPLPAIALTVDTSLITAIGNDYGYDKVFSRQVEGIGNASDVLIAISTSGNSKNVIEAVKSANKMKIRTIGFTGQNKSELSNICEVCLKAPSDQTNHIQEMHIAIGQLLCGLVEDHFFNKKK